MTQGLACDAYSGLLQAWAGRLPVTKPRNDQQLNRQASRVTSTAHPCVTACNRYHKRLFTDRTAINNRYFATIGCHFQHNTQRDKLYNNDRRIRFQHVPVLVNSELYAIFWGFSALPLILGWLNNHSTLTVYRLQWTILNERSPAPTCQQCQATLSQMNFAATISADSRLISCLDDRHKFWWSLSLNLPH